MIAPAPSNADSLTDRHRAHAERLGELAIQWMHPIGSDLPSHATREEYVFRHARLAARSAAAVIDPVTAPAIGTRVRRQTDHAFGVGVINKIYEQTTMSPALYRVRWERDRGTTIEARPALEYKNGATWRSWSEVRHGK